MGFSPNVRKAILSLHIAVSVSWLGAVVAYLVLDVTVATSQDPAALRAAYVSMGLITSAAIVPLAFATLVTGLVVSLGTPWGVFRHYWVVVSLVLTLVVVLVLVVETRTILHLASVAKNPLTTDDDVRALGHTLLHSVGGLLVLLLVLVLNVYKPRGLTPYGWRKQRQALENSGS